MSSRQYLASLLDDITPTNHEKREVQDAVDRVVAATRPLLPLAEIRPAGSWAKSTMLRGRKEADIVAILAEAPSDATLARLAEHLGTLSGLQAKPTTSVKAVNLVFTNGVKIDLLPTARDGRTPWGPSVPRKLRHGWKGVRHVEWLTTNAHGTVTHQIIRLMKHFRNCNARDFHDMSSFGIEIMCVEMGLRGNLADGFLEVLRRLDSGWLDGRRLGDPADQNNDVITDLTVADRRDIARCARTALASATAETWSAVFPGDAGTLPPPAGNLGGRTLG